MLAQIETQLKEKDIKLDITDAAKDLLGEKGYDPAFGARPLRRIIEHLVEDPLSEALLEGRFQSRETVLIDCQNGEIVLSSAELVTPTS
jgi:ATP-dependent Clp protease ATP-binding subunit ClpC